MKPFTLKWWTEILEDDARCIGCIEELKAHTKNMHLKEACTATLKKLRARVEYIKKRINKYSIK